MNLAVFGVGYVGAVSLACLARDGHHVTGLDPDQTKLDLIRRGETPVLEAGMAELMAQAVASGRVAVTRDVGTAVRDADVSFVCVGTPSAPDGSPDLDAMRRLTHDLGRAVRAAHRSHTFVFRSTLAPGTVDGVLRPILERESGMEDGVDFHVCYQPEFLREGSSIQDYDHPPFTIVGATHAAPVETLRALFGHLPCPFRPTTVRVAEMVKYCCNDFHAVKVTFANEVARLCERLGVDPFAVMDLMCTDRQLNISPAYLKPGFAFGGSCLPKDLRATLHMAETGGVALPMLGHVADSNRRHIEHAVARIVSSGRRRVGMIGLSFKSGTDDLRESPLVVLAERLVGEGMSLLIHDPGIRLERLRGANRRFIEDRLPQIGGLMRDDLAEMIAASELVVVGAAGDRIVDALRRHVRVDQIVLDLVRIPRSDELPGTYMGLCW